MNIALFYPYSNGKRIAAPWVIADELYKMLKSHGQCVDLFNPGD